MMAMSKTIAAICVGLILAAAAGLASEHTKYHRQAQPVPVAHSRINSGWGQPITWDEIEISTPSGAF
jgi:hypothetical protein